MTNVEIINKLLGELIEMERERSWDLNEWNEQAEQIYALTKTTAIDLPEIVWHYLSDADIRNRENDYGKEQLEGVRTYLSDRQAHDT